MSHHALDKAWAWLNTGDGRGLDYEKRRALAEKLAELEVELYRLDAERLAREPEDASTREGTGS